MTSKRFYSVQGIDRARERQGALVGETGLHSNLGELGKGGHRKHVNSTEHSPDTVPRCFFELLLDLMMILTT